MRILNIAYALAPVSENAVGGAEQILSTLDHALVEAGDDSVVVACRGSTIAGRWVDTGVDPSAEPEPRRAQAATREAAERVLRSTQIDLVHMHGLDFAQTLPDGAPPTLATLHLPPAWYGTLPQRPGLWLHCVSDAQAAQCPPGTTTLLPIANGVDVAYLGAARHGRRGFALMLGRVCPEKGQHLALQAAHAAGISLLVAGAVFPYPEHRAYFDGQVAPLLDGARRFLGPLDLARKRRLLAAARCLLVPSLAPETSSLVAMEAAACGTPVIAFDAGALPGIVEDGRTGFVVRSVDAMRDAVHRVHAIDPEACRQVARERFSKARMVTAYLERYRMLAGQRAHAA